MDARLPFPGGLLRIHTDDQQIAERLTERLGNLFVKGGTPTDSVTFVGRESAEEPWDHLAGDLIEERLHARMGGSRGSYDLRRRTGEFEILTNSRWFELYVENTLRMLLLERARHGGYFLVHAAAVLEPDLSAGYVFFGPSNAGKTTTTEASLLRGYHPLNDDLVFLKRGDDGTPWVYGCPFHGATEIRDFAEGGFPVRAIFRLQQAEENRLERLDAPEAAARMAASMVTYRPRAAPEQLEILEVADAITARVPVYRLFLRKGPSFWGVIEAELAGGGA